KGLKESKLYTENDHTGNFGLLVHIYENFRSFAVSASIGRDKKYHLPEYCLLTYSARFSTYAHEILHLFGADDYYSEFSESLQDYRSEFLSKSIMFSGGTKYLNGLVVDGITAQNIGWI
ncbi:MAG: hypothetical protein Q8Q33_06695, partial [Chlamydiota bacterium]|nr:hypothetical protein [Chlamydiota bacterium]